MNSMSQDTPSGEQNFTSEQDLLSRHPQLSDKAQIDWINGLEVVRDHLRVRQKDEGLLGRIFDLVTGSTQRRQQHIDQNLHTGLNAALSGLQDMQRYAARGDLAAELIANKLTETRAGMMRLQNKVSEKFAEIELVIQTIQTDYGSRISDLEQRTSMLEQRSKVESHIAFVLSKWRAGQYSAFTPLERLFVACNELQWGDYGDFERQLHRQLQTKSDCERLTQTVRNELIVQLRSDCGNSDLPLPITDWLEVKQTRHTQENQLLINCLSADYTSTSHALLPLVLADRNNLQLRNSPHLTRSAGPEKIVDHMLAQTTLVKEQLHVVNF